MSKVTGCVSVILLLLNVIVSNADKSDTPVVKLPDGQIQGRILKSFQNNPYYAFQQIPYASPPVGNLRFKEPEAPKKWDGILNATSNTLICFQGARNGQTATDAEESEDCLYINVYTPVKPGNDSTSLPVLVWIHGGDFYFGDGSFQSYGPQYLIDHAIVVVSFNYRLGPLGFLTTADSIIPGNLGLKDQNFALQWVKNNIKLFGGDPTKVTIVGENTGGVSVGYHIISEKSKGLFRGAIMQSGTVLSASGYQANAKHFAFEMGRTLDPNFTSKDSKDLLKLLQNASATDINKAVIDIPEEMQVGLGDKELIWLPIIENVNFSGVLITGPMHEDLQSGNINRVPVLLGYNSEEEITFVGDGDSLTALGSLMDRNLSRIINNKFNMTEGDKYIAGRGIRQIYTRGLFEKNFDALIKFMSDEGYTTPIIRHAELQSKYTDVYLYQFSHKGVLGGLNLTVKGTDSVGHGEDLNYLWSKGSSQSAFLSVSDKITQHRILKLWTNFVKYLNPTPDEDNYLLGYIKWPKVTSANITYLNINRTVEVGSNPRVYDQIRTVINRYATAPLVTY